MCAPYPLSPSSAHQRSPHPRPPAGHLEPNPTSWGSAAWAIATRVCFLCILSLRPSAPRERDDRRMGKGCLLGPGPFCGPFKSRPLNPFCSADRNCRPSPLRGRDQAAPSPTAAEPRAPSPPPGAGEGAPEAVRPEKRQRRGEKENANGRRRTLPLPATLDQLLANLFSSPPRDPRGPTLGAAPLPPAQPCRDSQLLPVPADTVFHKLEVCGNPASIKCIGTNFPTALFLNEGW
ncbi:uncharacterized protein [Bos indicus]|uniref:Uncharacterized protein n=1 Tax=Bos indicus TaxID=9915 RepID=A0ABM4R4R2_BOSIN